MLAKLQIGSRPAVVTPLSWCVVVGVVREVPSRTTPTITQELMGSAEGAVPGTGSPQRCGGRDSRLPPTTTQELMGSAEGAVPGTGSPQRCGGRDSRHTYN